MSEADRHTGFYHKFQVTRTDGSSEPGGKHEGCCYFVLDLDHDPHAVAAMEAYSEACRDTYPVLSEDIRRWVAGVRSGITKGGPIGG